MGYYIVEDDTAVADALKALLSATGQDVRIFASAELLIETSVPGVGDTVIVDLGLPGMSGAELVQWLESLQPSPRVFLISGKSSRVIERETRSIPAVRVLRKPPQADWFETIAG